jgi:protein tyrosine phosphatase (PTP) superfamily phosphohydrolase (DUF442 family)
MTLTLLESAATPKTPVRSLSWRRLTLLVGAGLLLAFAFEAYRVMFGANFHELVPGRVYRGAQPSPARLEQLTRKYGIRTVVNLRGCCNPLSWYVEEARACQHLGLSLEDVTLSAGRLPHAGELQRLVEILDRSEYPIFLHCRRGADRTGLTAALVMLLHHDATLAEARRHMGIRYGHFGVAKTAYLGEFFDLYETWLANEGLLHSAAVFRRWLQEGYEGGWLQARFEETRLLERAIKRGQPGGLVVRVRNLSDRAWRLSPFETAGMHVYFRVFDGHDRVAARGRGPLRDGWVQPGELLEATLPIPPLKEPGTYRIVVDLVEENHATFLQAGAEPREEELVVRE